MPRNKFWVWPYKQSSRGAIALAHALDGYCILRENSRYQQQEGDVIINWGDGYCRFDGALNKNPNIAIDKIAFYRRLQDTGTVPVSTTSTAGVATLMSFPVLCRTRTEGADGAGIVIAENYYDLVDAPLYVKLMPKTHEFRVHVGRFPHGQIEIIHVQPKIHQTVEGVDP